MVISDIWELPILIGQGRVLTDSTLTGLLERDYLVLSHGHMPERRVLKIGPFDRMLNQNRDGNRKWQTIEFQHWSFSFRHIAFNRIG